MFEIGKETFLIGRPRHLNKDRNDAVSATFTMGATSFDVWYKVSEGPIIASSEAFLASALLSAMKVASFIRIEGSVSRKLFSALTNIQEIYHSWNPECQRIVIEADSEEVSEENASMDAGCFFTGGVDSFYTLLKHRNEIKKLIFVHGYDIRLHDTDLRHKVSKELKKIAEKFDKKLIEVETNLRDFSDNYVPWDDFHGAALASVALLLSPQLGRIYIPSSNPYDILYPLGSHPLLDPLWSTEKIEFIHDGCEATRVQKVARISENNVALESLRVCHENHFGAYNCGQCEKCMRTMANLRAVGALDRCKAFDQTLDLEALAAVMLPNDRVYHCYKSTFEEVKRRGGDLELAQALRNCIGNYKRKTLEKEINKDLDSIVNSPWWRDLVSKRKNSSFKAIWEKEKGWLAREVIKESIKLCDDKLFKGKLYSLFRQKNG